MANTPINQELYNRVKAEAKKKFNSWPSAYGSAWLVKTYKERGGKYTTSKKNGGMSSSALSSMQSFYKDMQQGKYNPTLMQNSLDEMNRLTELNTGKTYLNKVESNGKTVYKGPKLFSQDPYVLDETINIKTHRDRQGNLFYKNIFELDQDGFATTNNLGYSNDVPEGTKYMPDAYGNDYSVRPPEMKTGGIPDRYKNMGFSKVGAKKQSTRPGKKWMVLAKKGDKYKIVHGGDSSMKDFKQHGSTERKKRFWDRMGGRNSAKASDSFSPLYWHKKFGTWQEGGQFIYNPNNPIPQFEMGNSILDKMKRETMRKGGQPCYECGGMYNSGGSTPFNADPNYYGERLEKFIGNIRNTAAENLFPDMEEEVMQMPQARYGMPVYQDAGPVNDPTVGLIDAPQYIFDQNGNLIDKSSLTYGSAVFDKYGNILGGYYRDGKMHARRPGKTYTLPNSNNTVTIDQYNNLNYNQPRVETEQNVAATESSEKVFSKKSGRPLQTDIQKNETITNTPATSTRPKSLTIAQRFEKETGLPWFEAGNLGLTDGTESANQALINRIEAGESVDDIQTSIQSDQGVTEPNDTSNTQINEVPEVIADYNEEDDQVLEQEMLDYNRGNQGMYTDPNTGMIMNVPQEYFNQQAVPANPQVGMYPEYGSPYLQRAQYKYGPLGKNLRRVDLQYGMPGVATNVGNANQENMINDLQQAGVSNRNIRKARREASKLRREGDREVKNFNKFVDKHGSPERLVESMTEGAIRGTDRNALMRAMQTQGKQPNATEGQRFEGYDLIARPDGEYEYRPQQMYGGTNPYISMYEEGGEYYMDEDTINMIMAMGGDVEFLD